MWGRRYSIFGSGRLQLQENVFVEDSPVSKVQVSHKAEVGTTVRQQDCVFW